MKNNQKQLTVISYDLARLDIFSTMLRAGFCNIVCILNVLSLETVYEGIAEYIQKDNLCLIQHKIMIFLKKQKTYVSYHLPILTLFGLSNDILTNIFVTKRLQHLSKLFYFILREQLLTLILRYDILVVSSWDESVKIIWLPC